MKIRNSSMLALALSITIIVSMFGVFTAQVAADDTIFVPNPTGIPETDWYNIQATLDAAMPGDTVQFAAGSYYIHRPLVKEGFSGTLKGVGQDLTKIIASKSTYGDLFQALEIDAWAGWEEFMVPAGCLFITPTLAYFSDCTDSVSISDLSLVMDEEDITEYSYIADEVTGEIVFLIGEEFGYNMGYAFILDIAAGCDTTLERVSFVGANDGTYFQPISPNHGFYVTGRYLSSDDDGGTHTALDCDFAGMGGNAYQLNGLSNAEVTVESCYFGYCHTGPAIYGCDRTNFVVRYNLFEHMNGWGAAYFGTSGGTGDISHNTMIDSGGLGVFAEAINPITHIPHENSYVSFDHNDVTLRQYGFFSAVEVYSTIDDSVRADLSIKGNKIHSEGAFPYGPIFTVNAHHAVISNNIITGSGPAAMYIGIDDWEDWIFPSDHDVMILGNNLQGWTVDGGPYAPYWEGMAYIWLSEYTSNCMVVGNTQGTVADFGQDNFLVGSTPVAGVVPGDIISDAMNMKSTIWRFL
ncbi:MAG: hypothetical protein ACFFEJ_16300 [Candidatus Thorarchaeota archaeon]